MKHDSMLLKAAKILHRVYLQRVVLKELSLPDIGDLIQHHVNVLKAQIGRLERGRAAGWSTIEVVQVPRVQDALRCLREAALNVQGFIVAPPPVPALADLYRELTQLNEELEGFSFDAKNLTVSVQTEPIELEDVQLGDFRIELQLNRLRSHADATAFDVIALDPHPASSDHAVTHPHVSAGKVCTGDATVPISQALKDGRICDAFLAINAVLHTYNPSSPYVSLDTWQGSPCNDCGRSVSDEDRYYCEDCGNDYCSECTSSCDVCENSYCRSCLEEDPRSGRLCCRSCRKRCNRCSRIVASDDVDEDSGLCPGCEEDRQSEESEEEATQSEIEHDESEDQRDGDPRPEIAPSQTT